ncbi:alanine racemase [Parahaliea mediterranea]|uniref:alanine racemase n=1 Tax=Parahaliea mediterranea TaxID=651086 RepID=UPI000E2EC0A2|nr:alanine racemase [Parahaliea mediterranea]
MMFQSSASLLTVDTPCLVLHGGKMDRNIKRLRTHLGADGPALRPHLKTAKSVPVASRVMGGVMGPATVSTLKEAEQFAAAGIRDMIYAVGIAPGKLDRVVALRASGIDLAVILDTPEQALLVVDASQRAGIAIPALIEIDSDGHRAGVAPADTNTLLAIARLLCDGGAELRGVLTHAGGSYQARSPKDLPAWAERERAAAVSCAATLRAAGLPCPVVSVGSTPTALFGRDFSGVTEVRAGVFVFFDLVMAGIGVCQVDDIALSVLATVIGHQPARGWVLVDAGWMALSRDRGTAGQDIDQGYGLVCDIHGRPCDDLIIVGANQEHAMIGARDGGFNPLLDLPIGTRVRILPNHACATAAQHDHYQVVEEGSLNVVAKWPRFGGW